MIYLTAVPKLMMFDLDGTLADTVYQLHLAVNAALVSVGVKEISVTETRSYIGNGASVLLARAILSSHDVSVSDVSPDIMLTARDAFNRKYLSCCDCSKSIYPGVRETLAALKSYGIRLAVVTNKPDGFIKPVLEPSGLLSYFDYCRGSEIIPQKKPDPAPLIYVSEKLGIKIEDSCMVGDSINDIQAAVNANIPSFALTCGYNQGIDLLAAGGSYLVDNYKEILQVIDSLR